MTQQASPPKTDAGPGLWTKLAVLLALVGIVVVASTQFGDTLTLNNLAQRERSCEGFRNNIPCWCTVWPCWSMSW